MTTPTHIDLADCDCEEQTPSEDYICEECESDVMICSGCHTILVSCGCGHCKEGATFHESE